MRGAGAELAADAIGEGPLREGPIREGPRVVWLQEPSLHRGQVSAVPAPRVMGGLGDQQDKAHPKTHKSPHFSPFCTGSAALCRHTAQS